MDDAQCDRCAKCSLSVRIDALERMLNAHEDRNKERFDMVARTTRLAADTLDARSSP